MFFIVGFSAFVWLVPWLLIFPRHLAPQRSGAPSRRRVTLNRNLLGICLGFFCFDYYWYLLVTWLPDYLVTVRHLTLLRAQFGLTSPKPDVAPQEKAHRWFAPKSDQVSMTAGVYRRLLLTRRGHPRTGPDKLNAPDSLRSTEVEQATGR